MITKMDRKRFRLLIRFLKEKNSYSRFIADFNADKSRTWRKHINFEKIGIINVIESAFPWGHDGYWLDIDRQWRIYTSHKRINIYASFNLTKFIS